jgi:hypothetical protein
VDSAPVIDLSSAAEIALIRMLQTGRVVGRDNDGHRRFEVIVEDWIVDWFGQPRPGHARRRRR